MTEFRVVVPWHREEEVHEFKQAWRIGDDVPHWLILQQDKDRSGCAVTKNRGVARALEEADMENIVVVVLDGDCFPSKEVATLSELAEAHIRALRPQPVRMFEAVTDPPSRGTPYEELDIMMPVAASMGYWLKVGDYCAPRQLTHGAMKPMEFKRETMFARYFPLCGMNLAFRPMEWKPWCNFINVDRFDDIWQGWLWQHEAYRTGFCFNLNGPLITHSRQSNVWSNLAAEAKHLEVNETLWREIAASGFCGVHEYENLRALLPVPYREKPE